jgi:hypothetical protein
LGIAQIKSAASQANIVVDNINYSSSTLSGKELHKVLFGVDLSGDLTSLKSFLTTLSQSIPLSTIDSLRISTESTVSSKISLSIGYYWSELPTKLPELESPIKSLTSEEIQLLSNLANFKKPSQALQSLPSTTTSETPATGRQNIFEIQNNQ